MKRPGSVEANSMYSRFMILSAVLGLTAAPLAAQTDLGFRAGVGLARMDFSGVAYAPCPPETDCHSAPDDWSLSPLISADVRHATGVLSFRVSFTYAVKGGAGSGGRYANGTPSSGTQRLHFLQFSPLLEATMPWDARGRFAVSFLFGPWAALRVGCSVAGALAAGCYTDEMPDAGVAFGGGIHYTVASTLTITAESIYHWGLVPNAGGGLTRLVAVQVGATIH